MLFKISLDSFVGFSHCSSFYLHMLPIDTLCHFNVLLFLGINIIVSGLSNIAKEGLLPQFDLLYCCNIA